MGIVHESVGTSGWKENNDPSQVIITKPTGLAVGELMIAQIGQTQDSGTSILNPDGKFAAPAGWTELEDVSTGVAATSTRMQAFYKVADSSDVAASNFTFSNGMDALVNVDYSMVGYIHRISGGLASGIQSNSGTAAGDLTETFSVSLTPIVKNSMLLHMTMSSGNFASGSVSSVSVATDNPSWTEEIDSFNLFQGSGDGLISAHSAIRPETTATGNSTVNFSAFNERHTAIMICIAPAPSVESTATKSYGVADFNKPTGLEEGDLLLAIVHRHEDDEGASIPSGFSLRFSQADAGNISNNTRLMMFTKIATATDVSASTFSFPSPTGTSGGGVLYRIANVPKTSLVQFDTQGGEDTDGVYSSSINLTPATTDNIAILCFFTYDNGGRDNSPYSSYALVGGTNPTFTETFDEHNNSGARFSLGVAHGAYNSNTTITQISCSGGASDNDGAAVIILNASYSSIFTATVQNITSNIINPAIKANSLTTILNPVTATFSINTPTINTDLNVWTNEPLPTPSVWTYEN